MKFYRTLTPFQVISFDLDDTLYDNSQVIAKAENEFVDFVRQHCGIKDFNQEMWTACKKLTAQQQPHMAENVTLWRLHSLQTLLAERGKSAVEISDISHRAMNHFLHLRHQINIPTQSIDVLQKLKKHYKLAAITNGNIDPKRIGLSHFDLTLRGGEHGRAKPHEDLFHQTVRYFNVQPERILHVGDNLITDVAGAIGAGCQAVWLNLTEQSIDQSDATHILPTVEICDLGELLELEG